MDEEKKHPREIIFYHENRFVSFFHWSLLDYQKGQKVRNSDTDDGSVEKLGQVGENIFRIPNDISHHRLHSFVRRRRVDACPQLWSEEWTVMLGKRLKHKYRYEMIFRKTPGNANKGLSESK